MSIKPLGTTILGTAAVLLLFLAFVSSLPRVAAADEKSHRAAALELISISYNEQDVVENARRAALPELKDRYENNPKTSKYSSVLIGLVLEVLEAQVRDPETQKKLKAALAETYTEEFTEPELRELIRYYRTPLGRKILRKLPAVIQENSEKEYEIGVRGSSSPKYVQMLKDRLKELQDKGTLPREFE